MSRFNGKSKGIILVSGNAAATAMFAGKTLNTIGFELKLEDGDVYIKNSINPNNNEAYPHLIIKRGEQEYAMPFARNFPMEQISNGDWLLECKVRQTFKAQKAEDGTPLEDDNGKPILDESAPYVSFGKPDGLTFEEEATKVFAEPEPKKKAAATTGMKK